MIELCRMLVEIYCGISRWHNESLFRCRAGERGPEGRAVRVVGAVCKQVEGDRHAYLDNVAMLQMLGIATTRLFER